MLLTIGSSLLPLADTHALYRLARAWGVPKLPHTQYNRLVAQLADNVYDPHAWFHLGLRIYCTTLAHLACSLWPRQLFRAELLSTSVVLRPSQLHLERDCSELTYHNLRTRVTSAADPLLISLSTRLFALIDPLGYSRYEHFPFAPDLSHAPRFRVYRPRADVSGLMVLPYGSKSAPYFGYSSDLRLWPNACSAVGFSRALSLTSFCLLAVEYMTLYHDLLELLQETAADQAAASAQACRSSSSAATAAACATICYGTLDLLRGAMVDQSAASAPGVTQSPAAVSSVSSPLNTALPADVYQRFLTRLAALDSSLY